MIPREVSDWLGGDALWPEPFRTLFYGYLIGDDHSLFYVNYWTVIHFVTGLFLGWWGLVETGWGAFLLHLGWEVWQLVVGATRATLRDLLDVLLDTGVFMLGWYLARWCK